MSVRPCLKLCCFDMVLAVGVLVGVLVFGGWGDLVGFKVLFIVKLSRSRWLCCVGYFASFGFHVVYWERARTLPIRQQ